MTLALREKRAPYAGPGWLALVSMTWAVPVVSGSISACPSNARGVNLLNAKGSDELAGGAQSLRVGLVFRKTGGPDQRTKPAVGRPPPVGGRAAGIA